MTFLKITLLVLFQCSLLLAQTEVQKQNCYKDVQVGNFEICLPEIEGMKECYDVPGVMSRTDKFEFAGNSILGFYVQDEIYHQLDNFVDIKLDEYFKIYVVKNMKDREIGLNEFAEAKKILDANYIGENWKELKEEVENNHDYLSLGKPVLIESYLPDEKAKTYLMLVKMESSGIDYVILMSLNIVLIKERLIWLAYYKTYEGDESVNEVKSKNDNVLLKFIDENK
jgi:hypothetical protein